MIKDIANKHDTKHNEHEDKFETQFAFNEQIAYRIPQEIDFYELDKKLNKAD